MEKTNIIIEFACKENFKVKKKSLISRDCSDCSHVYQPLLQFSSYYLLFFSPKNLTAFVGWINNQRKYCRYIFLSFLLKDQKLIFFLIIREIIHFKMITAFLILQIIFNFLIFNTFITLYFICLISSNKFLPFLTNSQIQFL